MKFQFDSKNQSCLKIFVIINFIFIKVALQCLFNIFILFNTVSYLNLNFKLKVDPKMCTIKNLREIWKPGKNFEKTSGSPVISQKLLWIFYCLLNDKKKLKKFCSKSFWLLSHTPRIQFSVMSRTVFKTHQKQLIA